MVDAIKKLFSQPIEIEICIGMAIALLVWIRAGIKALAKKSAAAARRVKLKDEIASLQKHLHTQMKINNKGNQALRQTLASLQETSQRLTQAVSVLKDKPGRAEIRTLHLYTKALSIMNTPALGFGSAWESPLKDAEAEAKKEESGIIGWIKIGFYQTKRPPSKRLKRRETERAKNQLCREKCMPRRASSAKYASTLYASSESVFYN
jgi:hypothetical protein